MEKIYEEYKKYTDTSVSYMSCNLSVATVDKNDKVSVNNNAKDGDTAKIIISAVNGIHC